MNATMTPLASPAATLTRSYAMWASSPSCSAPRESAAGDRSWERSPCPAGVRGDRIARSMVH